MKKCHPFLFLFSHAYNKNIPVQYYLPSDLTQDAWINVTGTYHYDKHKGMEITVTDIEDAEPSEEEYVYPIY